jgi:hypothetical protein
MGGVILKRQLSVFAGASQRRRRFSALFGGILAAALLFGATPLESHAEPVEQYYQGFTYTIEAGKAYIWDYAGNNRADSVDVVVVPGKIENKPVVTVELYDIGGKSLSFRQCTKLKNFYGIGIFFEKIDFSNTKELRTLTLDESGETTSLSLTACKKLVELSLSIDTLKKLSVNSCIKLKSLKLFYAKLRSLSLSKCASLRNIRINNTELTSISLGNNRSLKELDLESNKLKKLSVSACPSLEVLNFAHNSKLSVNISKNKKLKRLIYSPKSANGGRLSMENPRRFFPWVVRYTNM